MIIPPLMVISWFWNSEQDKVHLSWQKEDKRCVLKIDLENYQSIIEYIDEKGNLVQYRV